MTELHTGDQHERIERYLQGKLSADEQDRFERELFSSADFASEVELHQSLKRSLKSVAAAPLESSGVSATPRIATSTSVFQNATLGWLTAAACAAGLLLTIALPIDRRVGSGFVVTDELVIHRYRGAKSAPIETQLSSRTERSHLLLSIDTEFRDSEVTFSLSHDGKTDPIFTTHARTDALGALTLVLPSKEIPNGSLELQLAFGNGAEERWSINLR